MNYFQFYGIEEQFFLDEAELKQLFFKISKEHHPDFVIDDEAKYEQALETTSTNNSAFKALSKFSSRVNYILKLNEVLQEAQNAIPQSFLMEMMDINEDIMDLKMDPDAAKQDEVLMEVRQLEEELNLELANRAGEADKLEVGSEARKEILEKVKETYLKLKYVLRIRESLNTFAA